MECVEIDNHNMHLFRAGDANRPKLVFMSGSGTVAPVYDFKILYDKLVSDYRVVVIEKFGYGYSDLYEAPCDIDSVVAFQREALETGRDRSAYSFYEENAKPQCPRIPFLVSSEQART